MSNSKFKNVFSPERKSPERLLSPDLEEAIVLEFGKHAKEAVYSELKSAVVLFASNSAKFFAHFKTSPNEKWYESNEFLKHLPASLDLRIIVGLPDVADFEQTKCDFLPLFGNAGQLLKILDHVDSSFSHLQEPDPLVELAIRGTLLLEVNNKYTRFFYQQVKDASERNEMLRELKEIEKKLFEISFPKHLQTLALDNRLNPGLDKQAQLKEGLGEFFNQFDNLNARYRQIQRDLFHSYSSHVNFGNEVLPSEFDLASNSTEYFRKPVFNIVRKAVQDLMTRVTSNFDSLHSYQQSHPSQRIVDPSSYNDRLEDHLQGILNKIDVLGIESLRRSQEVQNLPSMDSLNIADESILSYQELVFKQTSELESAHLRHLICFEDDKIAREDLPSSDLFLDTLFALENIAKLSYDQLSATESVICLLYTSPSPRD